ncbi:MAG: HAMP domain-containing histidine kinase [Clostridia bacterium]|nr:HAMP domain-containing histidine kinase [Clostridia bacterium]
MDKLLRKKFIRTAMIAVSALIVAIILVINIGNIVLTGARLTGIMNTVSERRFENEKMLRPGDDFIPLPGNTHTPTDGLSPSGPGTSDYRQKPDRGAFFGITENDALNARIFRAEVDENGQVIMTDVGRISSVTEDEAESYAKQALSSGKDKGTVGNFMFRVTQPDSGKNRVITFLDVSSDNRSLLLVLLISLAVAVLGWLLMLLLVYALANKAIRPIAENIERQKQFVTDAGHEIKTPLAVIKANAEAMEMINGSTKWSRNIIEQTDRLSGLMQKLLSLARADSAQPEVNFSEFSVSELFSTVTSAFEEPAAANGRILKCETEDGLTVNSDEKSVRMIIEALLENAVKYSDSGSEITAVLKKEKTGTVISVENYCTPLPDVSPDKLFDRFYRADSSRSSEGYGIGLSYARTTAALLGAELYAEYTEKNKIKFTFIIK